MRLIDADTLKEKIEIECNNNVGSYCDGLLGAEILIDNTPTIDFYMARGTNGVVIPMTRPTGEWERHDEWRNGEYIGGFYHVNCPCEDGYYSKWETNFCPNCGAEMRNVKT